MSWEVFRTTLSLLAAVFFFAVNLFVRVVKWIWDLLTVKIHYLLPLVLGILATWYLAAVWREHHVEVISTVDFYYCEIEEWRVLAYETWHNNLETVEALQCITNVVFATGRILTLEFVKLTIFEDPTKLGPLFTGVVDLLVGALRAFIAFIQNPFDHRFNFFLIWDGYLEILDAIEAIFSEVCTDLFPAFQLFLELIRKEEICCFLFHAINAPLMILKELRNLALGDPETGEREIPSTAGVIRETCAAVLCLGDYIDHVIVDLIVIVFGNDAAVDVGIGCVLSRIYCLLGETAILITDVILFFVNEAVERITAGGLPKPDTSGRPLIPGLGPVQKDLEGLPVIGGTLEILGSLFSEGLELLSDLFEELDWEPVLRTLYNEACRDELGVWDPLNCNKPVASSDGDNDYDECDPEDNPFGFGFTSANGRSFYSALPGCGPQLAECVGYTVGMIDVCLGQVARYVIVAAAKVIEFVVDLLENGNFRFGELLAQPLLDILGSSQWDDYTSYGEFTSIQFNPDGTVNQRAVQNEDLLDVHIDFEDQHEVGGRPFDQTGLTCLISRILVGACGTALGDAVNGAGHIVLIPVLIGQELAWSDYDFDFGENPLDSEHRDDFNEFLLSILCIITDRILLVADLGGHLVGCLPGLDLLGDAIITITAVVKEVVDTIKELFILTVELIGTLQFWWIGILFGDTSFLSGDMFTIFFELLFEWLLELFDVILDLVEGFINFLLFFWFPSIFGQNTLMDDDPGPATFTMCFEEFSDCICGIAAQIFDDICLPWPIDKCISDMFGSCGCFEEDATDNCDDDERRRSWTVPGPHFYNNGTAPHSFHEYLAIMFNDTACGPTFDEFRYGKPDNVSEVAVLKYLECVGAVRESLYFSNKYPDMSYDWAMRPDLVRKTGANATKGMGVVLMSELMNNFIFATDPDELLDLPEKNATYLNITEQLIKRGINDTVALNVLSSMQQSIRNGSKTFWGFLGNSSTYYSDLYHQNLSLMDTAWEAGTTGLALVEITASKFSKANVTGKIAAGIKGGWNYWTGRLSQVPEAVLTTLESRSLKRRSAPNPQEMREGVRGMAKRLDPSVFPKHITQFDIFKNNLHHAFMGAKGYFGYLFHRPLPPPVHDENETEHNETDSNGVFTPQHIYQLQDHRPDSCNKIVEFGCANSVGVGDSCTGPDAPIRFYENTPLCQFFFGLGAIFTCEGNQSTASFFSNLTCASDSLITTQTQTTPNCFLMTTLPTSNLCGDDGDEPCTGHMCILECAACPLSQVIPDFRCEYLDNSMHRIRELVQNCLDKIGGPPLDPTLAPPFDPRAEEDNWVPPQITQRQGTDACGDGIVQPEFGEECDLGNFSSDPNKTAECCPFGRNYPCSGCNGCFLEFCGNNFPDCRPDSSPINPDGECNVTIPEIWCETGIILSGGDCPNSTNAPVSGLCCPTGTYNLGEQCCQVVCSDDTFPLAGRCCTNTSFPIHSDRLCCQNVSEPTCIIPTLPAPGLCTNATAANNTFEFELGAEPFGGFVEECDGNQGCSPGNVTGGQIPDPDNPALGGNSSMLECIRLVCGDGRLVEGNICPAGSPHVCFGLIENDSPFLLPFEIIELPLPLGSDESDCQPGLDVNVTFRGRNFIMKDPDFSCPTIPANCGVDKVFRRCSEEVIYSEECDDGNRRGNDGCNSQCINEICPDAYFSPGNHPQEIADIQSCAGDIWDFLFQGVPDCDDLPELKNGACDPTGQIIDPSIGSCGPGAGQAERGDNCILHISALRPNQCFNDPANGQLANQEDLVNEHTGQPFQGSVQFNCRGTEKWMWIYQDKECRGNYYVDRAMQGGCTTDCMFNVDDESVFVRSLDTFAAFFFFEEGVPCPSHINQGLDISCADNCFTCGNNITEPSEQCDDGTVLPTVNPSEDACIACQESCSCQEGEPCMGFCFGPDYPTPQTTVAQFQSSINADSWGRTDGVYSVPCNAQFESGLLGAGLAGYSPCGEDNLCIPKLCCGDDTQGNAAASVEEEYSFVAASTHNYFTDLEIACDPFNPSLSWQNGTCCWTPIAFSRLESFCTHINDFVQPTSEQIAICTVHLNDTRLMGRANPACAFQGIPWPIAVQASINDPNTGQITQAPIGSLFKTKKECEGSTDCIGCAKPGCVCQPNKVCVGRCIGGFWQGQACDANNPLHCTVGIVEIMGQEMNLAHLSGTCLPEACCGDGIRQNVTSTNASFPMVESCGGDVCGGWGGGHSSHLTSAEIVYSFLTDDFAGDNNVTKIHLESLSFINYFSGRFHDEKIAALTPDNCAAEELDGRWGIRANITIYSAPFCNGTVFAGNQTLLFNESFAQWNDIRVTCDVANQTWEAFSSGNVLLGSGNLTDCISFSFGGVRKRQFTGTAWFQLEECIAADDWDPTPEQVDSGATLYENITSSYVPVWCPGGYWDDGFPIFGQDGFGLGCVAVWPCHTCIPGQHTPNADYDPLVNDASCPDILDSNNDKHPACTDEFITDQSLVTINFGTIEDSDELRDFFSGPPGPLSFCLSGTPDDCDWMWTAGQGLGTPDDPSDDLDPSDVFDFWETKVSTQLGFTDALINWTITQATYYPCLQAFNTTSLDTDDPACCPDPTCGLSVPPRPGDENNDTIIELPPLPTFGTGLSRRKRQMVPAEHILRPSTGKKGKMSIFTNTKWTDDQDRFLDTSDEQQPPTAYDEYFHWVDTVHPTEDEIRRYHEYYSKPNARKRQVEEVVQQFPEKQQHRHQYSEDEMFIVHDKVRRQDANAPIKILAEGTPPKPDVITPLIFDIVDWLVDLFVDAAESGVDNFEDIVIDFLTCANVTDPFDFDSEDKCIVWYLRFAVPLVCELPGNFDCSVGIGFWNAVFWVGGALIITFVFGAYIWGSLFTMFFSIMMALFGVTIFVGVAWGYSIWCFPITPECIPREIDETLAHLNGTCIKWPEGFVTNPANGSCGKIGDVCLRRDFTDCAEHGFLDGFDTLVFFLEWTLPSAMQAFRNSFFFTALTQFPIDQVAEYFTLMFDRWDYSTQPVSERDITCFFVLGIWLVPQIILILLLIGILVWPLVEIVFETLRDLWIITLGFSLWIEAIYASNEDDDIDSLL